MLTFDLLRDAKFLIEGNNGYVLGRFNSVTANSVTAFAKFMKK
jgi:hypothetical protein